MKSELILLMGEFIDPMLIPPPSNEEGDMNTIKAALLNNFKALIWSKKLNKWIYVLYDEKEVALARKQFPKADCFTLIEMWQLSKAGVDEKSLQKLSAAKRIFNAKIISITDIKKE